MQKYNFALFLELWNEQQRYITPSIHYKMSHWLETSWRRGEKHLLLMAFRASGKSTIMGLFSAWLLWRDPDFRILVLAADTPLACKMVRNIKRTMERHPLTRHLKPTKIDQWASDRFTIKRHKELRDPSVLGAGVTSNITGARADLIIYDDVEVPNTSNTPEKRQALRDRLKESNFILTPGGGQIYIGTPHSYFSIYADELREEEGEEEIFLPDFKRFLQPILNEEGETVWPQRYTQEDIDFLRRQSGPNKFASQMMLQPVNILESRLNHELLQFYDDDLQYSEVQRRIQLSIMGAKIVSCSAWWDPAFGSAKGDSSVLAVVFSDNEGRHYLHHVSYIKVEAKGEENEAALQCSIVADIVQKYYIPSITIETNGLGRLLPSILRGELGTRNIPCTVVEKHNSRPKHERILESFDSVLAARALCVHEDVKKTPFLMEMMEWQPSRKNMKDDGLDAVAGALSLEPVRIKRSYANALQKWNGHNDAHQAKTDFDI